MTKVVRVGDTVRRETGPWTPSIHALLDYLYEHNFEAAPRPLGIDERGREILSFIPGDTVMTPVPDAVWFDSMADAARLLRRYHDLSTGFDLPARAIWRDHSAEPGVCEVVCHSDWAPYNAVWRDGHLVGMIDWDFAIPGSRLFDLAWFALTWCPLAPPERTSSFTATIDQPARLRELVDAYGLEDRGGLLDAIWARTESTPRWIEEGAAEGNPVHLKMLAEGHVDHYRIVMSHLKRTWADLDAALDP